MSESRKPHRERTMERTKEQREQDEAQAIAHRMARERGVPESLWQGFLAEAYREMWKAQYEGGER